MSKRGAKNRTKARPAKASVTITEMETTAPPDLTLEALLTTLARGRKGPIQVVRLHHPHQPGSDAQVGQAGQGTTDQLAGNTRAGNQVELQVDWEAAKRLVIPTPPPTLGEVPSKVEELVLAIEGLEKSVAILQDKLDPVLQPGQANTAGTNAAQTEPVGNTIIGERLRQAIAIVVHLRRRVADITERTAL